jgi:hypothetical protein
MRHICGRSGLITLSLVVSSLLFVALGSVRAQGNYSPVNETNIVNLTFNHYFTPDKKSHAADFEWTFTEKEFVLKKGTGAIPMDLLEKMLPKGSKADEIRGKWKLVNKDGQQLVLTEIKAGDTSGNKDVCLIIYKTAPTVVRIGKVQYVFGIGK